MNKYDLRAGDHLTGLKVKGQSRPAECEPRNHLNRILEERKK